MNTLRIDTNKSTQSQNEEPRELLIDTDMVIKSAMTTDLLSIKQLILSNLNISRIDRENLALCTVAA